MACRNLSNIFFATRGRRWLPFSPESLASHILTSPKTLFRKRSRERCRPGRSMEFRKIPQHGLCARRAISRWTWFVEEKYFRTNKRKSVVSWIVTEHPVTEGFFPSGG